MKPLSDWPTEACILQALIELRMNLAADMSWIAWDDELTEELNNRLDSIERKQETDK